MFYRALEVGYDHLRSLNLSLQMLLEVVHGPFQDLGFEKLKRVIERRASSTQVKLRRLLMETTLSPVSQEGIRKASDTDSSDA